MPGNPSSNTKKWLWFALLLAPALFLCERYLDIPLALWVQETLYLNGRWARHTSQLPDLLFPLVLGTTVLSLTVYWVRRLRGVRDTFNAFLGALAYTAPVSFLAKTGLKHLFGRINTRVWLRNPGEYGFHWLHGGEHFEGFPSGHMMVIAALLAACWRYYPRYRLPCLAAMVLLGLALIVTNYHFLSDVIAGGYLALALEAALCALLGARVAAAGSCRQQ